MSQMILAPPHYRSSEDAQMHAGYATLFAIAVVGVGFYLSFLLVKFIDSRGLTPKINKSIKVLLPFAYFLGVIILAMLLGPLTINQFFA